MAHNDRDPLLGQRAALILLLGILTAATAGVLTVLGGAAPAQGALASGAAFAASVLFFHKIIS
ncbi:hypothetical protein [Streptomyces sp. NBC_01304]|uniref:hypothetical protein n=1 Tax=Streptomyces sp. NBC_01304 TaxID=2903818 RepID=UPI002E143043|nr:hypothetical protein OG430_00030 [Streptomyces sp. NBC_01304]WSJ90891.1 hypothetical protein OG430_47480 [Streptomyces sp. NBC_01304]